MTRQTGTMSGLPSPSTGSTGATGPSLEKILTGIASLVISQVPAVTLLAGWYGLQIYVPSIYHGSEPYLVISFTIAIGAILFVETVSWAWVVLVVVVVVLGSIIWTVYREFPAESPVHFWNWLAWNCLLALIVALALHLYLWARRLRP